MEYSWHYTPAVLVWRALAHVQEPAYGVASVTLNSQHHVCTWWNKSCLGPSTFRDRSLVVERGGMDVVDARGRGCEDRRGAPRALR